MTRGEYQFRAPLPFTPGLDIAGEVAALETRASRAVNVGDAVVRAGRGWAGSPNTLCCRPRACAPKPARLPSFAQGGLWRGLSDGLCGPDAPRAA
ncbi:alcohol dehydrogenase catalytic domain-containing protein [Caulobacter segnis]